MSNVMQSVTYFDNVDRQRRRDKTTIRGAAREENIYEYVIYVIFIDIY
jgi:hypothetical protein